MPGPGSGTGPGSQPRPQGPTATRRTGLHRRSRPRPRGTGHWRPRRGPGPPKGRAAGTRSGRPTTPARGRPSGRWPGAPPEQAPGGPDPLGGIATGWAGLLFLIATAAEAGLPERALDEPGLAARPLPWVLHTAGRALVPGIVAEDAALLALAGLGPARAALVLGTQEPTPEELACVHALAADWARATAVRLHGGGPDDPDGVVAAVARRPGRITAEPGWIEAHLAVADTDLAVRRAGLDLDPGWVPWLGSVVRYVYA